MTESPVFIKTQSFLVWVLERTVRFPKTQRFVMAKRVQDAILDFQECIILAAKSSDPSKSLYEADFHLERLRRFIRICVDLKLLTFKQYEYSATNIAEIGRLLGGWMNSVRTGRRSSNAGDRVGHG